MQRKAAIKDNIKTDRKRSEQVNQHQIFTSRETTSCLITAIYLETKVSNLHLTSKGTASPAEVLKIIV